MKALFSVLALVLLTLNPAFAADTPTPGPVIGIGTEIKSVEGHAVVASVLPGGPAEKYGIKAGDRFVSIEGKNVDGLSLGQVAELLRGAAGSRVHLTIDRNGKTLKFSPRRQILVMPGSRMPSQP